MVTLLLATSQTTRAVEPTPCRLGGPAGTASVVLVDLPRGSPSLALRVTTPEPSPALLTRSSWHLATQVAVLRSGRGDLVASRVVQHGSNPRSVVATGAGQRTRLEVPGPSAPFTHTAAAVPPYLGPGRYLLVAYGTDGSPALPNPGWSAEASFGVPVRCVPLSITTRVLDRDHTTFDGGAQVSSPVAGTGSGTTAAWRLRERHLVGFADAQTQLAGDARLVGVLPRGRRVEAHNALRPFAGGAGAYRFTAAWTGASPLVLVCAVAFTP